MPDGDVGRWEGPQPVSHSSVGGALGFGAAVIVTLRLRVVRVEAAVHRRPAARDASHSGPDVVLHLGLRLGLRVLRQREAAALPRRYRLYTHTHTRVVHVNASSTLIRLKGSCDSRTRSSKVKSGVEHLVSSLDSSRWESLEHGVWGLEVVSGLAGLMGDGT